MKHNFQHHHFSDKISTLFSDLSGVLWSVLMGQCWQEFKKALQLPGLRWHWVSNWVLRAESQVSPNLLGLRTEWHQRSRLACQSCCRQKEGWRLHRLKGKSKFIAATAPVTVATSLSIKKQSLSLNPSVIQLKNWQCYIGGRITENGVPKSGKKKKMKKKEFL